jgi:UDP:flavonoid glycosyltransferase YjiC (YdhE family)
MRILMTSNRGAGHIGPLLPFAHAFLRAGDAGVPSVIVPGFADQLRNAERVAALGAGIALEPEALSGVGEAVRRLLDEPSYARVAHRVAAEVAALPAVDEAPAALRDWAHAA